ncbi:MAG: GNAT family N-acetyltransferase [Deltaproteobacteria bacterium]|nr:GNAT family N-acetyltransferase [Deltaproteobacteria bacterium]
MQRLETERLVLRAWTLDDAEDAFAIYASPEVARFLPGSGLPIETLEGQREWLRVRIERWAKPEYATTEVWAMELRSTGRAVGTLMLKPAPPSTDVFEIGWHLAPSAWGRGLVTEGARRVLAHGFEDRELDRIVALILPGNVRSVAVAERLGMRFVERTRRFYDEEADLFALDRT